MFNEFDFLFSFVVLLWQFCISPRAHENPIIIVIFVGVSCDLLLSRAFWEALYMGMEKCTRPCIVFNGNFGAKRDFY